jgi:hypothetical protein
MLAAMFDVADALGALQCASLFVGWWKCCPVSPHSSPVRLLLLLLRLHLRLSLAADAGSRV